MSLEYTSSELTVGSTQTLKGSQVLHTLQGRVLGVGVRVRKRERKRGERERGERERREREAEREKTGSTRPLPYTSKYTRLLAGRHGPPENAGAPIFTSGIIRICTRKVNGSLTFRKPLDQTHEKYHTYIRTKKIRLGAPAVFP